MNRMTFRSAATLGAPFALGLLLASSGVASAGGPFSQYGGNWTGTGTITTTSGAKERLRCKAHYDVGGGDILNQNLTCASDSYKFNVVANVRANGGAISGTWSETTRGADGQITGTIGPTQVSASVSGPGFSARIGIAARGGRQSITISPTGTDISNVAVTLSKS